MNSNIDFLIAGAGLYGVTIARCLTDAGFNCLIIEKRDHIGGNCYDELGPDNLYFVHKYGPHIFHTSYINVAQFLLSYTSFNSYQQNTIATDGERLYHLPFNMNTYYEIFGVTSIKDAQEKIAEEVKEYGVENPKNLEEQAISMVGKTIYEKLIKNYTEKQWNKKCTELSPDIIKRLPLRFDFNNNYFNDVFCGIPNFGYTNMIQNIINGKSTDGKYHKPISYILNTDMLNNKEYWLKIPRFNVIYCGAIDELMDYKFGELEWRSLRFEETEYEYDGHNGQGCAIMNYVGNDVKYTRKIEHMYFLANALYTFKNPIISIQTTEYPDNYERGKERYYPINDEKNTKVYEQYLASLSKDYFNVIVGGRLGKYKYFDMDDTILEALNDGGQLISFYKNIENKNV